MERFEAEAGPSKSTSISLVLVAGILSSVFALGLNSVLRGIDPKFEPMTWYFKGALPWGPILIGLIAGSGYVVVAFRRGVRATIILIASVVVLQFLSYGYAQFAEYRRNDPRAPDGSRIPFFAYYDQSTRNIAFVDENRPNRRPRPLGAWGYGVRAVEIGGFLVGAIGPLLFLHYWPYCHRCGVFMEEQQIAVLPWGLEHFDATQCGVQITSVSGDALWREIERMATEHEADAFRTLLQTWKEL